MDYLLVREFVSYTGAHQLLVYINMTLVCQNVNCRVRVVTFPLASFGSSRNPPQLPTSEVYERNPYMVDWDLVTFRRPRIQKTPSRRVKTKLHMVIKIPLNST